MTSSMRSVEDVRAELDKSGAILSSLIERRADINNRIIMVRTISTLEWVLDGTDFDELADWNDATEINF